MIRRRAERIAILIFILLFIQLNAIEYQVDKRATNEVKFLSNAPLESFEGITYNIDGYIYSDSPEVGEGTRVYFEVDLRTLKTGIGLRDRHMRDNYLETDEHPRAIFNGKIDSVISPSHRDSAVVVFTSGEFTVHGVTREIRIKGKLLKRSDGIAIGAVFGIKLSDYNIKIPKIMFLKLDENIKLEVTVNLRTISP